MTERQPDKPGGDVDRDEQAVENQSTVTPDDYPDNSGGKPDYKNRDTA